MRESASETSVQHKAEPARVQEETTPKLKSELMRLSEVVLPRKACFGLAIVANAIDVSKVCSIGPLVPACQAQHTPMKLAKVGAQIPDSDKISRASWVNRYPLFSRPREN